MAINFPNSPIQGHVYKYGDYTYTFDGVKWTSILKYGVAAGKVFSETPPETPEEGLMWYVPSTGESYLWYIDVDGGQWIQENPSVGSISEYTPLTTADLIGQPNSYSVGDLVETQGSSIVGDGEGSTWQKTALTGTASTRVNISVLNDAEGFQWKLVCGKETTLESFADLQTLQPEDGDFPKRFVCVERANAEYLLKPSGYVALAGDVIFANGRVAELQIGELAFGSNFGILPDLGYDISTEFNLFVGRLKEYGLNGYLAAGEYLVKNIRLESGILPWSLRGAGIYSTKLLHVDGEGTMMLGTVGSLVPYEISDMTLDCRYSVLSPLAANHAVSVADTNDVAFRRLRVIDYLNSAILIFGSTPHVYSGALIEDSECDGGVIAGNGFLIAEYDDSDIINSHAENIRATVASGPAFGLQLKNDCKNSRIIGGSATNCTVGVAFGFEDAVEGVTESIVSNVIVNNCDASFSGNAINSSVHVICDQDSAGESAFNVGEFSKNSSFSGSVLNVAPLKSAIRFRGGSKNNTANIAVNGLGANARFAIFDDTSVNNNVNIIGYDPDNIPSEGYRNLANFSTTTTNSFLINGINPYNSAVTISSGVATIANKAYNMVKIDTEGGAAADDLVTITSSKTDGEVLRLRTNNNGRVVTIKNTGNIKTLTGSDIVMNSNSVIYTFIYSSSASKWIQV